MPKKLPLETGAPLQQLILASSSSYRKSLLDRLCLPYTAHAPDIDERRLPGETPDTMVRRLSESKARAISTLYPDNLIIGSDQVAVIDDYILTKPGNFAAAQQQLRRQSGQKVRFLTGLALLNSANGSSQVDIITTDVVFRMLKEEEICAYLERDEPYSCAGSFRSEGLGITLFDAIHSSDPTALIGLPLIRLCQMLRNENYKLL